MGNSEGIGVLKLECPQSHPVGRIFKQVPHQAVQYDPGAAVGPRRFWPEEDEQQQFKTRCSHCGKPVGDSTATLRAKLRTLLDDQVETYETATLPYL